MRPHLHLDRERSPLEVARIRAGLTLLHLAQLTGGQLSVSMLSVMEKRGGGSPRAWATAAAALSVNLDAIRPTAAFESQMILPGTSCCS